MPDADRKPTKQLTGPLARLDRAGEQLAKAWLVRLIERASLDDIKELPTDRIAAELPALITDVLEAAAHSDDPYDMAPEAHERAVRLAELRESSSPAAAVVTRDVGAIQSVILDALRSDADELGPERFADLAIGVAEAVGAVQAAAVETLLRRRSRELESRPAATPSPGCSTCATSSRSCARRWPSTSATGIALPCWCSTSRACAGQRLAAPARPGDRVLVQVALAVRRAIRTVDVPARIGGDEFGVLVPQPGRRGRRARWRSAWPRPCAPRRRAPTRQGIGVAIGVVSCPEHGADVTALLESADQAMYAAKAGGDSVAVGDPTEPEERRESLGATPED